VKSLPHLGSLPGTRPCVRPDSSKSRCDLRSQRSAYSSQSRCILRRDAASCRLSSQSSARHLAQAVVRIVARPSPWDGNGGLWGATSLSRVFDMLGDRFGACFDLVGLFVQQKVVVAKTSSPQVLGYAHRSNLSWHGSVWPVRPAKDRSRESANLTYANGRSLSSGTGANRSATKAFRAAPDVRDFVRAEVGRSQERRVSFFTSRALVHCGRLS